MNKFLIPLFFSILLLAACKNSKTLSDSKSKIPSSKVLLKNMNEADFKYQYLSAKARVNFDDGSFNQNFTANIRIEHNKTIWLSLTGPFGIEGARVLIEPNRVQIINKLSNSYEDQTFEYINRYIPFSVDLPFLENLLVGNTFNISGSGKDKVELDKNNYVIKEKNQDIDATYFIDFDYKYSRALFTQTNNNRRVNLTYNDYKIIENQLFAFLRDMVFSDGNNNMRLALNFSKVKKESNLDFPFSVPERLKK
ncbi:MAG: DUF4292 domain-containing protein [Chitinophagales bacterium]|nr:DUF4292 domain-containing protein [Bacteroidota bacterium]MCB9227257.1 DUF4292 domain-containing protein [Chitinophagales bacterium]